MVPGQIGPVGQLVAVRNDLGIKCLNVTAKGYQRDIGKNKNLFILISKLKKKVNWKSHRICNAPYPKNGGTLCNGPAVERKKCQITGKCRSGESI